MTAKKLFPKKKAVSAPDEQTFRLLFENHPIPMWVYDRKTLAFLEVNDAAMEKYGYTRGEFLALTLKDIRPTEDVAHLLDHIGKGRPTLQHSGHWRHRLKNGRVIDVDITSHALEFEGRKAALVMAQDITGRKQAENTLRQSEERYHLLFDRIADGLYRSTHEGKFVDVNPAMIRMFGYASKEELLEVDIKKDLYFSPEERGSHVLDTGQEETETYRMKRKDGSEIWVEDHGLYVHDGQGNIVYHEGMLRDVTGRKRAEKEVQESETRYRTLFEDSPVPLLEEDFSAVKRFIDALRKNGVEDFGEYFKSHPEEANRCMNMVCIVNVNKTMLEWYGIKSKADLQTNLDQMLLPDEYESFIEELLALMQGGNRYELSVSRHTRDGKFIHLIINGTIIPGFEESWERILVSIIDITERKRAEQALQESETLYRQAMEVAGAVPYYESYYDNGKRIKYDFIGEGIRKITGYGPEEFTAALWDKLVLDIHLVGDLAGYSLDDAIQRARSGETSIWTCEHRIRARNGEIRWVFEAAVELRDEQGGSHGSIGTYQDITERKQAEEAINQRLAEQDILHQVSQSLLSVHLDPEAVYATLHRAVAQIMPCDAFNIVLDDENGGDYHAVYLYDAGSRYPNLRISRGGGLSGKVISDGETLFIHDNVQSNTPVVRFGSNQPVRSILAVPLRKNNKSVGMVSAQSYQPNAYGERHRVLLETLAAQVTTIIENARLFDETSRRAGEFASLFETSSALSAENELNSMLQVIVEHAKKLLGSESSGMYLYHAETHELELTVDTAHYTSLGMRLKLGEGVAGRVAQTHQPMRVDDYSTWEGRSLLYGDIPIRAVLEVPMLYGGELIGVLTADEVGDSERKFTEADERLLTLFASQAAGAIHSARLREQTARRLEQLQALHTIDRAISSSFDLRPILNTVVSQTVAQLEVDAADVLLFHPQLQILEYVAGQGFRTRAIEQTQLRLGEDHAGRAAFGRRTIHILDLPESGSNFTRAALFAGEGFLEYYGVPLIAKGEIKGVLEVFHRTSLPSNPEWQNFLETLAGQAAITIDQTQLFDNLQRANLELIIAYDATIEGWSHAMDLRDKETEGHTLRVTEMTLALAKAMGISEKELLYIRRGALLHDIGKMGIPDNILLKEGKLTDQEWKIMRQHPTYSYEMLQPIKYLRQSLDIPYCHHEKWDGTGYPRGLQGEQIPLVARIFAVIDVWDAVTIDRPYRKAWTKQKALKYIREQNGKHFDPQVVTAFLKLFDTKTNGATKPSQRIAKK